MSKENNLKFNFIDHVVGWKGQINATHLATKYQWSHQALSTVLQSERKRLNNLLYNQSINAFTRQHQMVKNNHEKSILSMVANKANFKSVSLRYGEINMVERENAQYVYNDQFGLVKVNKKGGE